MCVIYGSFTYDCEVISFYQIFMSMFDHFMGQAEQGQFVFYCSVSDIVLLLNLNCQAMCCSQVPENRHQYIIHQ